MSEKTVGCSVTKGLGRHVRVVIGIVSVLFVSSVFADTTRPQPASPHKRALLVGCTVYPKCPSIKALQGPANDLPLFNAMLKSKFDFQDEEITVLLGWPDEEAKRPTCSNIVSAFEQLVEEAQPDSQIVILISGHGTQLPTEYKQGGNGDFEDDGLDEVFLPADVEAWDGKTLPNSIIDDQFEDWLDRLVAKGAHVWITFDTCHSGTMTRSIGTEEPEERNRMVRSQDLAIPAATGKVTTASVASTVKPEETSRSLQKSVLTPKLGSLVAFSAAQSFEEAPELPRPAGAPRNPSHYYGLFTYSLVKALEQQANLHSYQDLSRSVLNIYATERGTRGPTPVFEGEMNRQVAGRARTHQAQDFLLKLDDGQIQVLAGELHGVTPGSILSIIERGAERNAEGIGYLKIVSVTPTEAVAEICQKNGDPQAAPIKLQDNHRCRMLTQDLGDLRIKLGVLVSPELGVNENEVRAALLKMIPEDFADLVEFVPDLSTASWIVDCLSPAEALRRYGVHSESRCCVLVPQNVGLLASSSGALAAETKRGMHLKLPFPTDISVEGLAAVQNELSSVLQKIFTWQNIWRVANAANIAASEADLTLNMTVRRGGETLQNPAVFHSGERVEIQLANEGVKDFWVTLLFLGSDYGIDRWTSGSIKAGTKFRPLKATVSGSTLGLEGFVVLASPISVERSEPRFDFLQQSGLLETQTTRSLGAPPNSPFGQLLSGAQKGKGTRAMSLESSDEPSVLFKSWRTLPEN